MKANQINQLFKGVIEDYHVENDVDSAMPDKKHSDKLSKLLYHKNWIDTVQWHLEDLIRDPKINPEILVSLKRRIDASNQERTNIVEEIDELLYSDFQYLTLINEATLNSETPAWLLDRMSILQLKIYHFKEQLLRTNIDETQRSSVSQKLALLKMQEKDLEQCYDELIEDLLKGRKYMKLYKQMKMYNDPKLNPILYKNT